VRTKPGTVRIRFILYVFRLHLTRLNNVTLTDFSANLCKHKVFVRKNLKFSPFQISFFVCHEYHGKVR
jgi:hypothetical protein